MNIFKLIKKLSYFGNLNINIEEGKTADVSIRIIKICNENCVFCSTDLDNSIISYKELILIVSFFIKLYGEKYILTFTFSGGEPTIYNNLDKIISFIINKGFFVRIETNAVSFSKKNYIDKFKLFKGNIGFFISFHSHKENIYNKITNSKLYNKAFLGIKNLYNYFGTKYITLNCVINKINFLSLKDYLYFLENNFYDKKKIKLSLSLLLANKKGYTNFIVKYSKIIKFLNHLGDTSRNIIILDPLNRAGSYTQFPFCIYSKLSHVDKEELFDRIFYIDKVSGSNIMHKGEVCNNCKFSEYCLGISKGYYNKYGDKELFSL